MHAFWLCFVPLLIAVDVPGVLPLYLGLTDGLDPPQRRRVILQSSTTASAVALSFLAIGKAVFALLGVTVADFMVAGGTLLFLIAVADLMTTGKPQRQVDAASLGAVPLGVPLIVGPAVLATSILLLDEHGFAPTAAALVANILLAAVAFALAEPLHRLLGNAGSKVLSKISSLLLASIAVMIVRKGLAAMLGGP